MGHVLSYRCSQLVIVRWNSREPCNVCLQSYYMIYARVILNLYH